MQKAISIQNLDIGYVSSKGTKKIVGDLNVELSAGEMTCLLGSNGIGKSTLMKTICGFLKSLSGTVLIAGNKAEQLNERELSKLVAVVLTEKIMVPNASVFELVSYGRSPFTGFLGKLSEEDKQTVHKSIEMCGIAHKKYSLLSSLSDGERQKATIAKALAQNTPIIILDEPTAFLDLPARVEIMQLLRKLTSETDKSVLMSTHDLDLALQMSDKLWLLSEKGIIAGSPEDLLLSNSFQPMFGNKGIEFDNKTGMFKVSYQLQRSIQVKGHGFEYVLLRRALMRKGIKPEKLERDSESYVKIENDVDEPFELWKTNEMVYKTGTVESIVGAVMSIMKKEVVHE